MMNAQDHANQLALAVWRLAEAERCEITAKNHRRAAAAILGAAHAAFTDELELTKEARRRGGSGARCPGNVLEQDAPATLKMEVRA
jgi:hypothetical protein